MTHAETATGMSLDELIDYYRHGKDVDLLVAVRVEIASRVPHHLHRDGKRVGMSDRELRASGVTR